MTSAPFDVAVVGGGIIGLCTAYHAQKTGQRTVLIEQYSIGNTFGSSAGKSRVIRYAHTNPVYLPLVSDTFKQIAEMEQQRGEKLWRKTGMLNLASGKDVAYVAEIMRNFGADYEIITAAEVNKRYPHITYGSDYTCLYDPMGGVVFVDKWFAAFKEEFLKLGGTLLESTTVSGFSDSHAVTLQTSRGDISTTKAVFALGTYINKLVPNFPVKSRNESTSVPYWIPKRKEDEQLTMPENYPVISTGTSAHGFFSLPSYDYKGAIKFVFRNGESYTGDDEVLHLSEEIINEIRAHIAKHLPFLDAENGPWRIDRCKYSMSPDEHYVIDYLPGSRNIQIAGFMSGTGFKNAPSIGKSIVQILKGEKPDFDMSFFRINRFENKSKL